MWEDSLWREMRKMRSRMDRLFSGFGNRIRTGDSDYRDALVDMEENENEFVLKVELPGVEKEDIKLNVLDNGIEIKAEKKQEKKKEDEKKKIYGFMRSYSGFYQQIDLLEEADLSKVDAVYKNGILTVRVAKKKIKVKRGREIKIS